MDIYDNNQRSFTLHGTGVTTFVLLHLDKDDLIDSRVVNYLILWFTAKSRDIILFKGHVMVTYLFKLPSFTRL